MTEIKQLNWQRDNFENIEEAWEGDLWERKRLGIQLTNYVDRLQCGAVLALDARWGEGKTWFVRHWQKHLENENHNVIYLDAFANDYLDDPFLTIAVEISQAFKGSNEIDAEEIEDFNSKTASVLISLASIIPMIAARAGLHMIGLGALGEAAQQTYKEGKELYDLASDQITEKVKEKIEEKINNHHIEKETIQDFKNELAKLAEKLHKPLVFIIDELDRCRPDFAIRLIERIKHFFDIPKIVFVLVMNKPQLLQSVKSFYGYDSEMNGDYLEKFIDYSIVLSTNDDTYNYAGVIRTQLYRVGEIETLDTINEFYFWVLILKSGKKFNSRELIKRINKYALLRTNNFQNDLILIATIFDYDFSNDNLYVKEILPSLKSVLNLQSIEDQDMEYYIYQNMDKLFGLQEFKMFDFFRNVNGTQKNFNKHGQQAEREARLKTILQSYSIKKLDQSQNFMKHWTDYINSGLIE